MDLQARTGPSVHIARTAAGIGTALTAPWFGSWVLAVVAITFVVSLGCEELVRRRTFVGAVSLTDSLSFLVALTVLCLGTGGAHSPFFFLLPFNVVVVAVKFSPGAALAHAILIAALSAGIWQHSHAEPPLLIGALTTLTWLSALIIGSVHTEHHFRQAAAFDPLTGLLNRRSLDEQIPALRRKAAKLGAPLSVIALDIDHFKAVNDQHGHDKGDDVLVDAATAILAATPPGATAYRVGGEEFLLLTIAGCGDAAATADIVRAAVSSARPGGLHITMSAGVATARADEISTSELLKQADTALYQAKTAGRDRTCGASTPQLRVA